MIALVFLFVFSSCAFAQTTEERLEKLEKALKSQEQTIQELKALQKTVRKQEQTIEEQRKLIEKLTAQTKQAQPSGATATAPGAAQTASTEQVQHEVEELKEQVSAVAEAQQKKLPSEFNPAIGLVGETVFTYSSKGSKETGSDRPGGFDVNQRSVELNIAAAVDPFAKGYAVINASADPITDEAALGVEEAAIQTTSLPCNLELKAGRFFGEFGRLAYIHDHELPFVNRPLVLDQYIGGESRTDGAQLNWLLPTEHYYSLTVGVGNNFGASPNLAANNAIGLTNGEYRPIGGLVYFGRGSTSFDLTPDLSLEPGISGLINPHALDRNGVIALPNGTPETLPQYPGSTLTERERTLEGVDLTLSWKPLQSNQFQSIIWGTEVLRSGNNYNVVPASGPVFDRYVNSYGMYSYVTYKWSREWSAGFLFDAVENAENNKDHTFAYSPYITWTISHWNQLRLQYTHTDHNAVSGLRPDDAVYLQWAWIIGSHAHGWQQR
jgi:uncharacterized coiled-coil protein SlyX